MAHSKAVLSILFLALLLSSGCARSPYALPLATPTVIVIPTLTPLPPTPSSIAVTPYLPTTNAPTAVTPGSVTSIPQGPVNFCADGQAPALIDMLKTAVRTSNGSLLASLISPMHGMEARFYRYGRAVTYDSQHAQFLFGTEFQVDWGAAPGSGQETRGAFHDVFVPALSSFFNTNYSLSCNQIQVGGTSYQAVWPYKGINYYSAYFAGTPANGNMDWHTWLFGMEYVNGKPYLYAMMQYFWEP